MTVFAEENIVMASTSFTFQVVDEKTGRIGEERRIFDPSGTAVVIVDMWNRHWCMTWSHQTASLVPKMNEALRILRELGTKIFWAPTDVADMYAGHPQRESALAVHLLPIPEESQFDCQFDLPEADCHCGPGIECRVDFGWNSMAEGLFIDESDYIVCGTQEVYSLCVDLGVTALLYMGGATNACLTGKPSGIIPMAKAGLEVLFARDFAEAWTSYDPVLGLTPLDGNILAADQLVVSGVPAVRLTQEFKEMGLWREDEFMEAVRFTPWGTQERPYFFRESVTISAAFTGDVPATIFYTLDGSEPDETSIRFEKSLTVSKNVNIKAAAYHRNRKVSTTSEGFFVRIPAPPPAPDIYLDELNPLPRLFPSSHWVYPIGINRSYEGSALRIRGREYFRGLGMRAPCNACYRIEPEYERFVASVGLDDRIVERGYGALAAGDLGIRFRVFIDGKMSAESPAIRISQEPWPVSVEIAPGSAKIDLVVMNLEGPDPLNLGNWINAGFIRRC